MIGKKFSVTEHKVTRTLIPEEEFYQYGKRFYNVRDSGSPKELVPYMADDFDARFKTTGKVNKRRSFHAKYRERRPDR